MTQLAVSFEHAGTIHDEQRVQAVRGGVHAHTGWRRSVQEAAQEIPVPGSGWGTLIQARQHGRPDL